MYGRDRDGVGRPVLTTPSGELSGMGNLTDAAINGRLFHCCSQISSTTSTTLNTTHVGLLVGNPQGSGKLLVMHEFGWGADGSITGEGVFGLSVASIGDMAAGEAPTIYPSLIGGSGSSVAYADQVGVTTGTLYMVKVIGEADDTAAGVEYGTTGPHLLDLKGSLVISPGYCVGTETNVALGNVMWFHFQWEEIDV